MQENSFEVRIRELEATVKALKEQVTQLSAKQGRDHINVCKTILAFEEEAKVTVESIIDLRARAATIEQAVYPKLGPTLQSINEIIRPSGNWEEPDLPRPNLGSQPE